jgi:hypothetical protein
VSFRCGAPGVGPIEVVVVEVGSRSRRRAVYRGTSERANEGRQHSSRTVRWTRSTAPFEVGLPARIRR